MDLENSSAAEAAPRAPEGAHAAPATSASGSAPADPFYIPPPEVPTQEGPRGIRYDFNDGARVLLPPGAWHVQIEDDESGNILFACDAEGGWVLSTKKYYVPFRVRVWDRADLKTPVLDHLMDLRGKPVLVKFPVGTIGDILGWFPYAEKFQRKHGCALECTMAKNLVELFAPQYPDLALSAAPDARTAAPYASYRIGLFFGGDQDHQPFDFRQVGLARTAGYILGVDPQETPPRLPPDPPRAIAEPYVCIAVQSTNLAKTWRNGLGWEQVVDHLKGLGYRVLCIDRERITGHGWVWNGIPHGAEDFTGERPLAERAAMLHHADFFVGLSSGLSWLAWAAGTPVVMISGFTLPTCEFPTPYRVHNTHVCHGCWDATDAAFDHHDYFWCPRHKGTERQFECTRAITGRQAIRAIERLRADLGLAAPNGAGGKGETAK